MTVYLQCYYDPTVAPDVSKIAEELVAEYEAAHPGVEIELVPNLTSGQDFETSGARMAANESPDIMWQQFATATCVAKTWWTLLNDQFELPNPYVAEGEPGSARWPTFSRIMCWARRGRRHVPGVA